MAKMAKTTVVKVKPDNTRLRREIDEMSDRVEGVDGKLDDRSDTLRDMVDHQAERTEAMFTRLQRDREGIRDEIDGIRDEIEAASGAERDLADRLEDVAKSIGERMDRMELEIRNIILANRSRQDVAMDEHDEARIAISELRAGADLQGDDIERIRDWVQCTIERVEQNEDGLMSVRFRTNSIAADIRAACQDAIKGAAKPIGNIYPIFRGDFVERQSYQTGDVVVMGGQLAICTTSGWVSLAEPVEFPGGSLGNNQGAIEFRSRYPVPYSGAMNASPDAGGRE